MTGTRFVQRLQTSFSDPWRKIRAFQCLLYVEGRVNGLVFGEGAITHLIGGIDKDLGIALPEVSNQLSRPPAQTDCLDKWNSLILAGGAAN